MTIYRLFCPAVITVAMLCAPAQAEFAVTLGAGAEYDSNVEVEAAETDAGLGDTAAVLDLKLELSQSFAEQWKFRALYLLNDIRWQNYNDYDTRLHTGIVSLRHQAGVLISEVSAVLANAELDGNAFLQMQRVSPSLGWMVSSDWYLRTQLDATRKDFNDYDWRDSDGVALRLQFYRFLDRTAFYLTGYWQWKAETADNPEYSYHAGIGRLALKRDWTLGGWLYTARLFGRAEHRAYQHPRADIGESRHDWRLAAGLAGEAELGAGWSTELTLRYDDYRSNLSAADYSQYRVDAGVQWQF